MFFFFFPFAALALIDAHFYLYWRLARPLPRRGARVAGGAFIGLMLILVSFGTVIYRLVPAASTRVFQQLGYVWMTVGLYCLLSLLAIDLLALAVLGARRLKARIRQRGANTANITDMENTSGAEWEFRRVLGIYGRNLSVSEKKYFKRWSEELGYSVGVVSEAYDLAVLNTRSGRGDLRYMDSVLTTWHEAGCKTVSDCRQHIESEKAKRQSEKPEAKKREKSAPKTPRYGNFDINEAFNNAVARSFGDLHGEEGENL